MAVTPNYKSAAIRPLYGTWTHAEDSANESFSVAGYVYDAKFSMCDATGDQTLVGYSVSRSTTTGISTITIHCNGIVTDGRYIVWVSAM